MFTPICKTRFVVNGNVYGPHSARFVGMIRTGFHEEDCSPGIQLYSARTKKPVDSMPNGSQYYVNDAVPQVDIDDMSSDFLAEALYQRKRARDYFVYTRSSKAPFEWVTPVSDAEAARLIAENDMQAEKIVEFSIRLPGGLKRAAEDMAAKYAASLNAVLVQAVREYFGEREAAASGR